MKGKIVPLLFALPFFSIGVWMAYSIGSNLLDVMQMKNWEPTQARLQRAGYERHSGDDSDTFEAYAHYTYDFGGQQYPGTRVAISGGADNIGDYQVDLGNRLTETMNRGDTVTVYVDPDNPSSAVIDRSMRWGLAAFKSIFLFVFGGIGLALIIYVFRSPKEKDLSLPQFREMPWLANDDWQSQVIKSNSKSAMYISWGFAAIWNVISAPLPFVVYNEVTQKANMPALVGLLFPLVGLFLAGWAIRSTVAWKRFGAAPVELDPFPGSIGGHVGGTIDINLPFDSNALFSLTLTNLFSRMSGTGKDRSRKESAKWQDTQLAHVSSGPKGSRLSFRFDVPEGLSESAADKRDDAYYLWQLNVTADLPGADFDRDYEIPVYATAQQSSQLSGPSIDYAKSKQRRLHVDAIEKIVNLNHGSGGMSMIFPMGRNLGLGLGGFLFGGVFAGAGWLMIVKERMWFMGGIFGFVGLVILLSGLYFMLNSLEITQQGGDIRTVRRVIGFKIKDRILRRADFVRFTKTKTSTSQSGNKHVVRYSVSAVDRNGNKIVLGEGFSGSGQADVATEYIGDKFGLRERSSTNERETEPADHDFLASD